MVSQVCVIGAGIMGSGIAQVIAQAGLPTHMIDVKPELLERGMSAITTSLGRLAKKGAIKPEEVSRITSRISTTTSLKDAASADYVIEAVFEKAEIKRGVFQELEEICPPQTILASNTSGVPISLLAAATKRPDKVIGCHFMNPVPVMKGVEVIRSLLTSDETLRATLDLLRTLGKEAIVVKDSPGFVANRIIALALNEGAKLLEDGIATVEDIDKVNKLSFNWPMGPFELSDLIGIDTLVNILEGIYEQTGWERYKPARLLKRMAELGYTGRKSGKGFYELFGKK